MLVIDKYVKRLIALADRHVILEGKGRVVWSGSSAALDADRGVWAAPSGHLNRP